MCWQKRSGPLADAEQRLGFSSGTLTVIFALYIAGLLGTLLLAGQLPDRYGRKLVLIPGLLAALVACLLFASATSITMLAISRFLAGIAVGVIVSAGMAAVVDVGGSEHKRLAALLASVAMVLGAGLGPLLAGGMACAMFPTATGVQFAVRQWPIRRIFAASATATVLSMAALVLAIPLPWCRR